MARIKLNVIERLELGTSNVRRLRLGKVVPGVVYGKGKKAISVKVPIKDIYQVKGGHVAENVLLDLVIGCGKGQAKRTVIVKEIQKDPIKGDWLHIDFNEISLREKLKTPVSIEVIGEAKGVTDGGVLDHIMHELEVECLPTDIPEHISVDVTNLEIGDTLYVKDLVIPEKVTVMSNLELPVISVAAPRAEEEVVAAPAPGEEGETTEPEVISKGKKEEEGLEEGAEAKPKAKAEAKVEKKPKEETKGKEKEKK